MGIQSEFYEAHREKAYIGALILFMAYYWTPFFPIVATATYNNHIEKNEASGEVVSTEINYPHLKLNPSRGVIESYGLPCSTLEYSQRSRFVKPEVMKGLVGRKVFARYVDYTYLPTNRRMLVSLSVDGNEIFSESKSIAYAISRRDWKLYFVHFIVQIFTLIYMQVKS